MAEWATLIYWFFIPYVTANKNKTIQYLKVNFARIFED